MFLDFDGTITRRDTGVHLLERLGAPGWRDEDARYDAGTIGSRECLRREWDLLPHDEETLRAVAREVDVDPGFAALVEGLRAAGADVLVVSDGFGFHVAEVCGPLGVPVLTNTVDWTTGALEFPNADRCCPCSTCGTCKQAPLKEARRRGQTTVFVGDGISDRKAALLADIVFAKGRLAEWCELGDVAFTPFGRLDDVRRVLFGAGRRG